MYTLQAYLLGLYGSCEYTSELDVASSTTIPDREEALNIIETLRGKIADPGEIWLLTITAEIREWGEDHPAVEHFLFKCVEEQPPTPPTPPAIQKFVQLSEVS